MPDQWRTDLRAYRLRRGLTQAQLASAAGLSTIAIKSYEAGKRRPSAGALNRIIRALGMSLELANAVRSGADLPVEPFVVPGNEYWFTHDELCDQVQAYPWPVFVVNEPMYVLHANRAAELVWGVDLSREYLDPAGRNLVAVAADDRFASQAQNLDEILQLMTSIFKRDTWSLEEPPPLMAEAIARFAAGNPVYLSRLFHAWDATAPAPLKPRMMYRVKWLHRGKTPMNFLSTISVVDLRDDLSWNEWIPVDAASWRALEELRASATGRP